MIGIFSAALLDTKHSSVSVYMCVGAASQQRTSVTESMWQGGGGGLYECWFTVCNDDSSGTVRDEP